MFRACSFLITLGLVATVVSHAGAQTSTPRPMAAAAPAEAAQTADPFLWLEQVDGARATAWVKTENAKTLGVLQQDPHFAGFYASALAIGEARDRIATPQLIDGHVYNFWQDAEHVRGIWRTTTLGDYAGAQPAWTTVLDLDALAKTERKNWVWGGVDCDSPGRTRCLVLLSEGGEDAQTVREFDRVRASFVSDGFVLPRGKQSAAWADDDTLLVSREWRPGELTASGYPYIVKRLQRGQALVDAVEIFRGTQSDVAADPAALQDGYGHRALLVRRAVSFFESETQLVTPAGVRKLDVPAKSDVQQLIAGRLLIALSEPWAAGGGSFASGSLVAIDLNAAAAEPAHLKPTLVYAPGPRETLESIATTRDHLIVAIDEDVKGRAFVYTPQSGDRWSRRRIELPDNSAVVLATADPNGNAAFLRVSSFLMPPTLSLLDPATGALTTAKAETPKFDASQDVVEQHFATSKDGTRVPYFIVRPKNLKFDGAAPTILYGYGGFSISLTPDYDAKLGKLWLENGGVYVLANIRGGGEYGPAWHDAGLKTNRQRIYDDFTAVARDLIAKRVTAPRHLGIEGGSNGGLLMGVEFTQHPELWNAVDIEVPLLDMLRFEQIAAGASWVGEYGSVSKPDERAFLASISPYANLKRGVAYPEPFVWTTSKDDRVGPQHARKFAAKLASLGIPYLFYEVTEGGHGAGANIKEKSFTTALAMTYFTRKLK